MDINQLKPIELEPDEYMQIYASLKMIMSVAPQCINYVDEIKGILDGNVEYAIKK